MGASASAFCVGGGSGLAAAPPSDSAVGAAALVTGDRSPAAITVTSIASGPGGSGALRARSAVNAAAWPARMSRPSTSCTRRDVGGATPADARGRPAASFKANGPSPGSAAASANSSRTSMATGGADEAAASRGAPRTNAVSRTSPSPEPSRTSGVMLDAEAGRAASRPVRGPMRRRTRFHGDARTAPRDANDRSSMMGARRRRMRPKARHETLPSPKPLLATAALSVEAPAPSQ